MKKEQKSMKTTVIYHNADFDGIFCREIARKFLPDAELIGWNFGDCPLSPARLTVEGSRVFVMDLPIDKVFGISPDSGVLVVSHNNLIWIDHHKSAIETHQTDIHGYRIDGVAACRLAWQWFATLAKNTGDETGVLTSKIASAVLPNKQQFVDRAVTEPLAVLLAGEYDVWDKRDPDAELFQHGLRSCELDPEQWAALLTIPYDSKIMHALMRGGRAIQYYRKEQDKIFAKRGAFDVDFGGLRFLALNAVYCNSATFVAATKPEHDGLLGFFFDGRQWNVSLYGVPHKPEVDLSAIAVKHGGGGHKQACGFRATELSFLNPK
jgi:oligoribonuclease NrnB/cAMP/cGMP phosphodiesterase (DHH superfamily)